MAGTTEDARSQDPVAGPVEGHGLGRTSGRWRESALAAAIAGLVMVLLGLTLDDYGFAWDEGFTVERVDRLREWFDRDNGDVNPVRAWSPASSNLEPRPPGLGQPGTETGSPWSPKSLRFFWQFAREEPNGHPPFYALLGWAGLVTTRGVLSPPACYRVGPALLFAVTVGAIFGWMSRAYGRAAGITAALGLLTMPRVFAHAHLASYDAPTLCLWFLAVAAFRRATEDRPGAGRWAVAFGLALGCAAATKLTGWFVPIPLIAWTALYRDRRGARALLIGVGVAALTVYGLTPTWWADPIGGVRGFLRSNLGREARSPIPTAFFGTIYPFSLPWYNTLVWTAIVVPPLTLALAVAGIGRVVAGRLRDRTGTLLLGCWAFLMVLRALPAAPGHDGERQFLPAFGFLACLAGVGVAGLSPLIARFTRPGLARPMVAVVLAGTLGAGAWSTWRFHPLQLSYYNSLIGGLSGASRKGLEPTYYWDALTPEARAWINTHTDPGRSVLFIYPLIPFEYLHHWGLLTPPPIPSRAEPPQWFVVQNRPGILRSYPNMTLAAYLLDHARPAYTVTSSTAPDVPLVAVFAIEEAAKAEQALERASASRTGP